MPSEAQMIAAFGIGAGPTVTVQPVFNKDAIVYKRSNVVGIGATNTDYKHRRYKVVAIKMDEDASGNILDRDGATAVGSTVADVATDGTNLDTATEWPTFYVISPLDDSDKTETVHESDLLDIDGVNLLLDSEVFTD